MKIMKVLVSFSNFLKLYSKLIKKKNRNKITLVYKFYKTSKGWLFSYDLLFTFHFSF